MKKQRSTISNIISIILWTVLIYMCIRTYDTYKSLYFNGFIKGEQEQGITEFIRDNEIKYGKTRSFKMESKIFNDAMFYKEISVKPNTSYKISCMVKTENVIAEKENSEGGALISIAEESEVSDSIRGTNDWQELTMCFNSKGREKIKLGFRLGGNDSNAKGTVWFDNIKLEEGITTKDTDWKMACFIINNIDVEIDNIKYQFSMSKNDIEAVKENVKRFTDSCKTLSNNRMTAECDIYEINDPIKTISYEEEQGYYFSPQDLRKYIGNTVLEKEYDYVFIAIRMGNSNKAIPVEEWIGLGGMKLYDVGYSIIRMPNEQNSYIYTYDSSINRFPEEVYLHEFLHTLERISNEYNVEVPALHDYLNYGYKEEAQVSLKEWYKDYMRQQIKDNTGRYIGIHENVYTYKPANNNDFKYSIEIDFNKEPKNIIEEIRTIFSAISNTVEHVEKNKTRITTVN